MSKIIEIKLISYQSHEYEKMIELRYSVLRRPLGLEFTKAELEKDIDDTLIGGFVDDDIVSCCILTRINNTVFKLRQMAVSSKYQNQGLGQQLLYFAENYASNCNASIIELNTRKTAVQFYEKSNYSLIGDLFIEVGIEHYKMQKKLL